MPEIKNQKPKKKKKVFSKRKKVNKIFFFPRIFDQKKKVRMAKTQEKLWTQQLHNSRNNTIPFHNHHFITLWHYRGWFLWQKIKFKKLEVQNSVFFLCLLFSLKQTKNKNLWNSLVSQIATEKRYWRNKWNNIGT